MAEHEVLVSVQARGFETDPRAGHLAAAVLGDSGTVLVPRPPGPLLDPDQELQVLTIPVPLNQARPIERLTAYCKQVMTAGPDATPLLVVLKLRRHSRYPATISSFVGPALAAALDDARGDLWAAMEAV